MTHDYILHHHADDGKGRRAVRSDSVWFPDVKTPLTYYGGKKTLAPRIVAMMPPHRAYCEPFCGGAAVLFEKPRAPHEIIGDIDADVIAWWRAVRDYPVALQRALHATPYSRTEFERCRGHIQDGGDPVEIARRAFVAFSQSYGRMKGGIQGGSWGVPSYQFRPEVYSTRSSVARIPLAAQRLRDVEIECADAIDLIEACDEPGTLIYCDPPYAMEARRDQSPAYESDDDGSLWPRLVACLVRLRHADAILSGYDCAAADALVDAGWYVARPAHRNMMVKTMTKHEGSERLWLSPSLGSLRLC